VSAEQVHRDAGKRYVFVARLAKYIRRGMAKCPYCGFDGELKELKRWRFRFYDVRLLECLKCGGRFNFYSGITRKGRPSEFTIKVKPR